MKQFLIAFCVLCAVLVCAPAVAPVVLAEESAPAAYAEEAAPEQEPDLSAEPQTFEEEPAAANITESAEYVEIPESADVPENAEPTYGGEGEHWQEDRVISFDQLVSDESYQTSARIPIYVDMADYSNPCGPIAGAITVGFYDIKFSDLIPSFMPGVIIGGNYNFLPIRTNSSIQTVIDELYVSMKTNQGQTGTTKNNFLQGLQEYFDDRNLNFDTEGLKSWNSLNFSKLKEYNESKNVALLFLSQYHYILNLNLTSSQLSFEVNYSNNSHIVVVYGCREITFIQNGVQQTEYFLEASIGFDSVQTAFIRVNDSHIQIDDFIAVEVSER